MAGDAHGFGDVVSLSLFFIYFGRAHELVTRFVFFRDHIRHVMERTTVRQNT